MTSTSLRPRREPKQKARDPIEAAITIWFNLGATKQSIEDGTAELLRQSPKRWVVYEPLVLLPAGSFGTEAWRERLALATEEQRNELWSLVISNISKTCKSQLTHLAVNEGIPLQTGDDDGNDNILRSPRGLRMLYGDFGPSELLNPGDGVQAQDFRNAFWVSTKQNGIFQIWAPRWTMFSRGNIKEKARLLGFHSDQPDHPDRELETSKPKGQLAVDLYAGIGYFVFSYAKLGMQVICWELNPWSVEGLRRGAEANGWAIRLVQGQDLDLSMDEILSSGEKIVVFLEDNREAKRRLGQRGDLDIRHVNCGLLPTSQPTWRDAWEIVRGSSQSWLHLHENVGVSDIATRRAEIQGLFEGFPQDGLRTVMVKHLELVKTFAPGVWHCVFDVYIGSSNSIT